MSFPLKRPLSYLLLFSFFFQTIWPSVVWAEALYAEIPSHGPLKRFQWSLGVKVDHSPHEEQWEAQRTSAHRIKVESDQGVDNLQKALDACMEIQALYPGLRATEKGFHWTSVGLSFLMSHEGTLVVSGSGSRLEQRKNPTLRLFNPHGDIIFGEGLDLSHVVVDAQDISFRTSRSIIETLEIRAQGGQILGAASDRTTTVGQFQIDASSTLKTQALILHKGMTTIKGTLSLEGPEAIVEGKGNPLTNDGIIQVQSSGARIEHVSDFQNDGAIQGEGLTLVDTKITNADTMTLEELSTTGATYFFNNGKVLVKKRWSDGSIKFVTAMGSQFTVEGQSVFYSPDIKNGGSFTLLGDSRGFIKRFLSDGSLLMGPIPNLDVTTFTSTGSFEVTGPMSWSGKHFKTTKSTLLRGQSQLKVFLETEGLFSALEDLTLQGSWHHRGGIATLSKRCVLDVQTLTNRHGSLNLLGETLGKVHTFVNLGPLRMHTVSDLRVRSFLSSGDFEVKGPMSWAGVLFQAEKTTFKDKTSIAAREIQTKGPLTAESDLTIAGSWHHQKGRAQVESLSFQGPTLKTEPGTTLTVVRPSTIDTDRLDNGGVIRWRETLTGRIAQLLNQGGLTLEGDTKLTGTRILNAQDFKALGVFDWVGEVLENTRTGRMSLFDNQVVAVQQILNQGLLLWTHNTFRTGHLLNLGWAEMTQALKTAVIPDGWQAPQGKGTDAKKSTFENGGMIKLAPKDYTPRMTVQAAYDHWLNSGTLQLPETTLPETTKTFKNEGDLVAEGSLKGHVGTFDNTGNAVLRGPVELTGEGFSSTGAMTLSDAAILHYESFTTGGEFTAQSLLEARIKYWWHHQEGGTADIARLLFQGKGITNHGDVLIRELLGSSVYTGSTIPKLVNGGYDAYKKRERDPNYKVPLFRIQKGGASLPKVTNWAQLVLEEGWYRFQDLTNLDSIEADWFVPEGSKDFELHGKIHATHFVTSFFQGNKIIVSSSGQIVFDYAAVKAKVLETQRGSKLTLNGHGTSEIGKLDNEGTLTLNDRAEIKTDALHNGNGTIQSSAGTLRLLMLDPDQSAQTFSGYPTIRVKVKGKAYAIFPGILKAKDDLILEMDAYLHLAECLRKFGDNWQCGGRLKLYSDQFLAEGPITYPGAASIIVRRYENDSHHLVFRSLEIEAKKFRHGKNNDEMALLETKPDENNPTADTSISVEVEEDLDTRYGQMASHGTMALTSTEGDVLAGERITETQQKGAWSGGCFITHSFYEPNGSFLSSNKDMRLSGKNVILCLADVKTQGLLTLQADQNVRSLASKIFAKTGALIRGQRFDHEIFDTDYCQLNQVTYNSTPGNGHMSYTYYETPQRSAPASLESLGDIRFRTKVTRVYGSSIRAGGSLIDQKGVRWQGKDNDCPFICYESQGLYNKWYEANGNGWYGPYPYPAIPAIAQAGKHVRMSSPAFRNSGQISGFTVTMDAAQAAFQHLGKPAQKAIELLMELGILSVRHFVEPDINPRNNGLMRLLDNGTVRQFGSVIESKPTTPLNQLPIIGQLGLGAPAHTKMYTTVSMDMEKLQQMLGLATGRIHWQGHAGESVFDVLLKNGQRQAERGALVDVRQNPSTDPYIAWALEKVRNAQTQEEGLLAVLNLVVPEALRYSAQTGEALAQQRLVINVEDDLDLVGAKLRSEEEKVKARVRGNLNASAQITTHGGYENFHQTAQPTMIQAPKDSVDMVMEGAVNVSGIKVGAEKSIDISGRSYTDRATRRDSHSVVHHGKKKTTTHRVHHDVSEYTTTGDGSTIHLASKAVPFYGEAPRGLTGPGGKTTIEAPGIAIVGVHDEVRTESIEKQSDGGPFGGSTTIRDIEHDIRFKGAVFNNILELIDTTGRTGITLVGADCSRVTKAIFDCEEGLISLKAGINAYMKFHSEQSKSAVWQSYEHEMRSSKTYTPCQFTPECEFDINSKIPVLVEQVRGQALAWIGPLQESLVRNGGKLNLQELEEIYKHEHFEQGGPTAAAALVVALAITICTAGAMSAAGAAVATSAGLATTTTTAVTAIGTFSATTLTAAGTVVQAMVGATLGSLTVSAANCILYNTNDLGKALNDFMKTDTWKNAGKAAVAAGLLKVAANSFGAPGSAVEASKRSTADALKMASEAQSAIPTPLQNLSASAPHYAAFHALNMATNIGVDVAWGQNLEKSFGSGAMGFGAGLLGALGSHQIGAAYAKEAFDAFTHKLLHAGVGAASGAIMGGTKGATAGAMGAFVAETFADVLSPDKPMQKVNALEAEKGRPLTAEEFTRHYEAELAAYKPQVENIQDWARIVAATTALLADQDVSAASMAATNAIQNNFLLVAYYGVVAAGIAWTAYDVISEFNANGAEAALKKLGIDLVVGAATGGVLKVGGKVACKIGSMSYPTVEAALTAVLNKNPTLRLVLGNLVDKIILASEKLGKTALGQGVAKAEVALGKMESKAAEKLGMKPAVKQPSSSAPTTKKAVKFGDQGSAGPKAPVKENQYGSSFPDRPLPRDKNRNPIPDSADGPHTQLGMKESRSGGKYPQAREFDANGKPVRDIDFTDHGRPNQHPNPHVHEHIPNPTGGTPQRSTGKPLE